VTYLVATDQRDDTMLCVFHVPVWAERVTVTREGSGEAIVSYGEDELIPDPGGTETLFGCRALGARAVGDLLRAPGDYAIEIPGAFPPRTVRLTKVVED
jgi:hypothetical protein